MTIGAAIGHKDDGGIQSTDSQMEGNMQVLRVAFLRCLFVPLLELPNYFEYQKQLIQCRLSDALFLIWEQRQ